jgi:hypothetical protein
MKKLLFGLALAASISAFAASGTDAKTTDMYAPKGGGSEFLAGILIPTGKVEQGASTTTRSGFLLNFQYAYGFSDVLGLYVNQGYASIEDSVSPGSSKTKVLGLTSTAIGVKGLIDQGQLFFYYSAGYELGLFGKPKNDIGSGELTAINNRPALKLQGGIGANFGIVGAGGMLGFDMYQDGDADTEASGVTTTTKHKAGSGSNVKIYVQYQAASKFGFSYAEQTVDSYDTVTSNVTTSTTKTENKILALYTILPLNPASELFFEISKPEPKTTSATYSILNLSAVYRMTF